jgi:hypothetical protein
MLRCIIGLGLLQLPPAPSWCLAAKADSLHGTRLCWPTFNASLTVKLLYVTWRLEMGIPYNRIVFFGLERKHYTAWLLLKQTRRRT